MFGDDEVCETKQLTSTFGDGARLPNEIQEICVNHLATRLKL